MEICNIFTVYNFLEIYFMKKEDIKKFVMMKDIEKPIEQQMTKTEFNKPTKKPKLI